MKRRVGKILSYLLVLLMIAGNVQVVNAATNTSTEGSAGQVYYSEYFEYPSSVGVAYTPDGWKIDAGSWGDKVGNLTIAKEGNNYYYSVDGRNGGPRYLGKVWGAETTASAVLEFDFRLKESAANV